MAAEWLLIGYCAGHQTVDFCVYRKLKSYVGGLLLEGHVRDIVLLGKNNARIHMPTSLNRSGEEEGMHARFRDQNKIQLLLLGEILHHRWLAHTPMIS